MSMDDYIKAAIVADYINSLNYSDDEEDDDDIYEHRRRATDDEEDKISVFSGNVYESFSINGAKFDFYNNNKDIAIHVLQPHRKKPQDVWFICDKSTSKIKEQNLRDIQKGFNFKWFNNRMIHSMILKESDINRFSKKFEAAINKGINS